MFISDADIVLNGLRFGRFHGSPSDLTERLSRHYSTEMKRHSLSLIASSSLFKTDFSGMFFDSMFGSSMPLQERRKQARRLQQRMEKERVLRGSILM